MILIAQFLNNQSKGFVPPLPCLGATFYKSWGSSGWSPVSLAQRTSPLKNLPPSPGNYKTDVDTPSL